MEQFFEGLSPLRETTSELIANLQKPVVPLY
jgi:hypothetical protein